MPVATIFLIASIWLALTGGQGFGPNQWASLMGIFVVSVAYIVLFYCLGAFVSSVVLDQTLSSFSCFGVWILFVIIVPAMSPYIAKSLLKVPDLGSINRQTSYILNQEYNEAADRLMAPLIAQGMPQSEIQAKIKPELDKVVENVRAKARALVEDYKRAATQQAKLSIRLACLSPYSVYLVAVEELSGMGFERFVMYLTGMTNIRDVAPFPRTADSAEF